MLVLPCRHVFVESAQVLSMLVHMERTGIVGIGAQEIFLTVHSIIFRPSVVYTHRSSTAPWLCVEFIGVWILVWLSALKT